MEFTAGYSGPVAPGDTLVNSNGDTIGYIDSSGQLVQGGSPQELDRAASTSGNGSPFSGTNPLGVGTAPGSVNFQGGQTTPLQAVGNGAGTESIEDDVYGLDIAEINAAIKRRLARFNRETAENETNWAGLDKEAGERLPKELQQSRDMSGARGMLHAGGFLEEQGGIQKNIGDYRARLLGDRDKNKLNLKAYFDEDNQAFNAQKARARAAAAARAAERAREQAANQPPAAAPVATDPAAPPGTPGSGQQPGAVTGPTASNPTGATPLGNGTSPANAGGGMDKPPIDPNAGGLEILPPKINYGNGQNPGAGAPIIGRDGQNLGSLGGAPKASPTTPVTTIQPGPNGARALTSFDPKSQAALKNGGIVVGGDSRKFKLVNGVAAYIGM